MFVPLSDQERHAFFNQNTGCYIPGYTGHCPTLRFHYGAPYGTKTKEILQDLRDQNVIKNVARTPYRLHNIHDKAILQPLRERGQMEDPALVFKDRSPRYIIGYTGFVPTLNFRYGKSYGRAADDSMYEFSTKQRRIREQRVETARLTSKSAPKLTPIRNYDEVKYTIRVPDEEPHTFKEREISPDFPPIAGYTGYIPKVKGNEESLSQRYNNVVKRSLTLLKEERESRNYLQNNESHVKSILKNYQPYDLNRI